MPPAVLNLIFEGDSLSAGYNLPNDDSYPSQLAAQFSNDIESNVSSAGDWISSMLNEAVTQVDPLYSPIAYKNICVLWGGCNDFRTKTPKDTVETVYNNIVSYCQARKAVGWQVIVLTLAPDVNGGFTGYEAFRLELNAFIRENYATFADALADVGNDAIIGQIANMPNETYWIDYIHMTAAGYAIVADYVKTAIDSLL